MSNCASVYVPFVTLDPMAAKPGAIAGSTNPPTTCAIHPNCYQKCMHFLTWFWPIQALAVVPTTLSERLYHVLGCTTVAPVCSCWVGFSMSMELARIHCWLATDTPKNTPLA